tara:strand:+ start:739 stop:1176 length:438 start_codon:yes stop_codon:yes gene_type:complete
MDLVSKYLSQWENHGYTTRVKPWAPINNRAGQTTHQATVTVEELVTTGRPMPKPKHNGVGFKAYGEDASVTVEYDPEDRRVEVVMSVGSSYDVLTMGCSGARDMERMLDTLCDNVTQRQMRHRPCFDLALQLVRSINSDCGPGAH